MTQISEDAYFDLATLEVTAPNYWDLTSDVDDQLQPLKVDILQESEEPDLRIISVKIKNLDSMSELKTDDQPDSEDVRRVQIVQVLSIESYGYRLM